jgi:hypothetical protein
MRIWEIRGRSAWRVRAGAFLLGDGAKFGWVFGGGQVGNFFGQLGAFREAVSAILQGAGRSAQAAASSP